MCIFKLKWNYRRKLRPRNHWDWAFSIKIVSWASKQLTRANWRKSMTIIHFLLPLVKLITFVIVFNGVKTEESSNICGFHLLTHNSHTNISFWNLHWENDVDFVCIGTGIEFELQKVWNSFFYCEHTVFIYRSFGSLRKRLTYRFVGQRILKWVWYIISSSHTLSFSLSVYHSWKKEH